MTQQPPPWPPPTRRPLPSPVDPFPLTEASANEDPTSPVIICLYGDGELEGHRLEILRHRVSEAKLKVWYPGAYHRPSRRGTFRVPIAGKTTVKTFTFRSNAASVRLYHGGEEGGESSESHGDALYQYTGDGERDASHAVELPTVTANDDATSSGYYVVELETTEEEGPPCLAIQDREMLSMIDEWQWRGDRDETWTPCQTFDAAAKSFEYPHLVSQTTNMLELSPKRYDDENGVWDFGVELCGWICFSIANEDCDNESDDVPLALFVGESLKECLEEDVSCQEQSTELIREWPRDDDQEDRKQRALWRTKHLVAFRYARVHGSPASSLDPLSVHCRAVYRPVTYRGSFRCPEDSTMERIWHHSAYTLRLTLLEGFVLDGIKRDRLPWMGDLLVALLANAYSFADRDVIAWTLTALGRAGIATEHVNGFLDYTLLWIISQDLYQLYFDDRPFLRREWPRIKAVVGTLIDRSCDDTGFLLIDKERDRIFLDWIDDTIERYTAVQIMWWRALGASAAIASRIDDADAKEAWASHQGRVHGSLGSQCQDDTSDGLWLEAPRCLGRHSRHAIILAAVWNLNDPLTPRDSAVVADRLLGTDLAPVGTPYLKIFECLALANLGRSEEALERIHAYWGGMLDQNATAFWESFDHGNSDAYSMYGRRWAKSLCHAWASGPLFFLPQVKLGITPVKDGWTEWAFNPSIQTNTIEQTVPTPNGLIDVMVNSETFRVTIPAGTVMHHGGKRYEGPQNVEGKLFTSRMAEISDSFRGWTYYPAHVIASSPEGIDAQMTDVPTVYRLPGCDDVWFMSFVGFDGSGYQSYVAESKNLVDWTNIRLAFGYGENEGDWDYGGRVLGAYLYEDYDLKGSRTLKRRDGLFWGLFGAYRNRGGYEIDPGYEGVAVSDDGLTWRRASEDPILSVSDGDCDKTWEGDSIYQPWLFETKDGRYLNFYNAKTMIPDWTEQIGLAKSEDLIHWRRHDSNPIICVRSSGDGHDARFAADAKVYRLDEELHVMFYFGVNVKWHASIMVAYSSDLKHWVADPEPLYRWGGHPGGLDEEHAHKTSLVYNPENDTFYLYYCAVTVGESSRGIGLLTSKIL